MRLNTEQAQADDVTAHEHQTLQVNATLNSKQHMGGDKTSGDTLVAASTLPTGQSWQRAPTDGHTAVETDEGKPSIPVTAAEDTAQAPLSTASETASAPSKLVIVWDLDETLIIFNALLNGAHQGMAQSMAQARRVGETWAEIIFDVLDKHFNFRQVEHLDPVHLEDVMAWRPQQAPQPQPQGGSHVSSSSTIALTYGQRSVFRKACALYAGGLTSLLKQLPSEQRDALDAAWLELETITSGWASAAAALLQELVEKAKGDSGQLVATLAKLQLFRLSDLFRWQDVFSASQETKLSCFQRIQARCGPAGFIAIGDGSEEQKAASDMGWPFVKVALQCSGTSSITQSAELHPLKQDVAIGVANAITIHMLEARSILALAGL